MLALGHSCASEARRQVRSEQHRQALNLKLPYKWGVEARLLKRRREKVRRRQDVRTGPADEKLDDDGLTIFDVESGSLTGTLSERQQDRKTQARQ